MKESVTYQAILEEGGAKGEAEGQAKGETPGGAEDSATVGGEAALASRLPRWWLL